MTIHLRVADGKAGHKCTHYYCVVLSLEMKWTQCAPSKWVCTNGCARPKVEMMHKKTFLHFLLISNEDVNSEFLQVFK
jgi:hypothetical protein